MKKTLIITIIATLPIFAGCNSFTPEQMKKVTDLADKVVLVTQELQDSVVPMIENLNEQGIVSDADTENIKKISEQIDKVQEDVVAVSDGIKTIQSSGIKGIIETGQAVNKAIPSPYQGIIDILLYAAGAIATAFGAKKVKEGLDAKTALKETVVAIQAIKKNTSDAEVVDNIKNELSKAQSDTTKKIVAILKT